MRIVLSGLTAIAASVLAIAPAQAQGGGFMWCQATAENGAEKTAYYSAFFAAGAHEAEVKARAFKVEVGKQASGATVTAKCMAPGSYEEVVAARNAAMKAAPGKVVSWEG